MASQLDITNRALLQIGTRSQISSFTEGSTEADAAAVLFTPTFEGLARTANWNCLRNQAVLSLIAAAQGTPENPEGTTLPLPQQPWLYAYQYPADCLRLRFLLPTYLPNSSGVPISTVNNLAPITYSAREQIPFAVAYGVDATNSPILQILTNLTQAQAVYTVNQPNPVIWDSLFQQGMVSALAAYFVPALSLNMPLMQAAIASAKAAIAQARAADGNETYVSQNREADWIVARNSGYSDGAGYGWTSEPCQDMAWPG